jgi:ParB family chromosome partitioning protein
LIENLQRKDLTAWEEADGLRALCERFGYTHEQVAHKVGKSRSSVTEALSVAALPEAIREQCRRADIGTKSLLLQIVRQPDEESMSRMAEEIASRGMTRDDARLARRAHITGSRRAQSANPYTYRYTSPARDFKLELRFRRSKVEPKEIAEALKSVTESLERE